MKFQQCLGMLLISQPQLSKWSIVHDVYSP